MWQHVTPLPHALQAAGMHTCPRRKAKEVTGLPFFMHSLWHQHACQQAVAYVSGSGDDVHPRSKHQIEMHIMMVIVSGSVS